MKDENNNLGDFFRKRLSSLEDGEEDWFSPDPRTDDRVLQGLVASSNKKKSKKKGFFILLLCLLFLGMLSYIIHLKQHITSLNDTATKILAQKTFTPPTSTTTTENTITLNNTSVISNTDETRNLESSIDKINSKYKIQAMALNNAEAKNQALQKLIEQQNKTIQALQLELSQDCNTSNSFENILANTNTKTTKFKYLYPSIKDQTIATNERETTLGSKNLFLQNKWNDFLALNSPKETELEASPTFENLSTIKPELLVVPLEQTEATPDYSFSLKKKKKKKRKGKSLEIGLHAGLQALFTEKAIDILDQRVLFKNDLSRVEIPIPYVGLNIAYSPRKNLWVRIGVKGGGNIDGGKEELVIVYNDAQEYLLPSGDRANDLVLNTSTGYTQADNTLGLTVPSTVTNGDLLELEYGEQLKIKHLQIPLSVEYFFGQKRWQPFVHGGLKFNLFHYEYRALDININSESQELNFDFNEGITNTKTVQYMSLMGGAGLNCNLLPQLSLRGTLGVEMNYIFSGGRTTNPHSSYGLSADFGLYYKF
jgi:hypothetical protein